MTAEQTYAVHESFSEVADKYDGFILDQFGVMHNGKSGLEGASDCVKELVSSGKKLIILSNSSSSAKATKDKLPKLGFDPDSFVGAVTSGEEASHYVKDTFGGKKGLFITWKTPKTPSPHSFIEQCGDITVTSEIEEADFILLHGVDVLRGPGKDGEAVEKDLGDFHNTKSFDLIDPLLKACSAKHIPMICANPDFIMVRPDGSRGNMPGLIVQRYEEMGGSCKSFGKPYKEHFEACLRDLGLPKDRVAHVGDSLHHDVVGANDAGIDSVFVTGGVHLNEIDAKFGCRPSRDELDTLFKTHGEIPTHVVPLLKM